MTCSTGISAARLADLHISRDTDADFSLLCQGTTIAAHSFILAGASKYFEMLMSKDWMEKKAKRVKFEDCSARALSVAVDFMYGINIPMDFTGLRELLHIADLFMMENLTEVVVRRFVLTKENYLEVSQAADLYNSVSLVSKCADFVYVNMGEGLTWEEIGKLPKVMAAFGERVRGKNCSVTLKAVKKRKDFASEALYGEFVYKAVQKGTMVRVRLSTSGRIVGNPIGIHALKEGDVGIVDSKGHSRCVLGVKFGKVQVCLWSRSVEVLA